MRRYKYSVLVRLDAPDAEMGSPPEPGGARRVTLRAVHHQSHTTKFFSALVAARTGSAPWSGGHSVEMTLSVLGDDVPDYLDTGDEVALWRGA